MNLYLSLLLLSFITSAIAQTDNDWKEFKNKHKKGYLSATEETTRRIHWEKNFKKVKEHNDNVDKGLAQFRLALNHLADRSDEEYKAMLGKKPAVSADPAPQARQVVTTTTRPTTKSTTKLTTRLTTTTPKPTTKSTTTKPSGLPKSIDYRNSTCTAPVKDQGNCGSCWAFSATYETEFFNCKKKGSLTILSEQNLVDCDTTNYGCDGGWYDYAWQYTIKSLGQCSAASYPYKAIGGTCKRSSCTAAGTLTKFAFVPNNVTAIMEIVANVGPVSVSVDANPASFEFYSSGVYADSTCTTNTNHAINIVGYGETTTGIPYWIIRNSWSNAWGMNGYGFIKRGVNMCGIEGEVAYPTA